MDDCDCEMSPFITSKELPLGWILWMLPNSSTPHRNPSEPKPTILTRISFSLRKTVTCWLLMVIRIADCELHIDIEMNGLDHITYAASIDNSFPRMDQSQSIQTLSSCFGKSTIRVLKFRLFESYHHQMTQSRWHNLSAWSCWYWHRILESRIMRYEIFCIITSLKRRNRTYQLQHPWIHCKTKIEQGCRQLLPVWIQPRHKYHLAIWFWWETNEFECIEYEMIALFQFGNEFSIHRG